MEKNMWKVESWMRMLGLIVTVAGAILASGWPAENMRHGGFEILKGAFGGAAARATLLVAKKALVPQNWLSVVQWLAATMAAAGIFLCACANSRCALGKIVVDLALGSVGGLIVVLLLAIFGVR
jgi:hypothetical protein